MNVEFEKRKLERAIDANGENLIFQRAVLNQFKEETGENEEVTSVRGIYRETFAGFITVNTGDSGKTTKQYKPMVLFLNTDDTTKIQKGHFFVKNGKKHVVADIKDILNAGYAFDISFEVEDE